jgi:hypothetical protein
MFKLVSIFQPGFPFLGLARFPSPVGKCEGSWTVHEWWAVHVIKGEGGGVSTGEYQDSGWSSGHWSCTIIVFISFRATAACGEGRATHPFWFCNSWNSSSPGYCSCATVGHPSHSGVRGNFSLRISFFSIGTHIPFLCEPPTHANFNNMQIQCGICISFYDVACWHEAYWIGICRIWQRKICGLY